MPNLTSNTTALKTRKHFRRLDIEPLKKSPELDFLSTSMLARLPNRLQSWRPNKAAHIHQFMPQEKTRQWHNYLPFQDVKFLYQCFLALFKALTLGRYL